MPVRFSFQVLVLGVSFWGFFFSFGGYSWRCDKYLRDCLLFVATAGPILNPHKHEGERYK